MTHNHSASTSVWGSITTRQDSGNAQDAAGRGYSTARVQVLSCLNLGASTTVDYIYAGTGTNGNPYDTESRPNNYTYKIWKRIS